MQNITEEKPLYFAYGANMGTKWLRNKGVVPLFSSSCTLFDYSMSFDLDFPFFSNLFSGLATIFPYPGSRVHGVLHLLRPGAFRILDIWECTFVGLYARTRVMISLDSGINFRAETYIGRSMKSGGVPKAKYLARLLDGAREFSLPSCWTEWLEGVETR